MSFAAAPCFAPQPEAPQLADDVVRLRGHVLADFDTFWQFYETTDRAGYMGVPKTRTHLWYGLSSEIVSWPMRGMGAWAVDANGAFVGQITIQQPPHFPEIEIGWVLFDGHEGHGFAGRAAQLALDWFWGATDQTSLVSYITPENARSIALATRLGAHHDVQAPLPDGETPEETHVYRHRRPA